MIYTSSTIATRFFQKIELTQTCWWWRGSRNAAGYGKMSVAGFRVPTESTHRVAWYLTHGPIPEGMQVLHACDQPSCVNPRHLFLGTNKDNRQDSMNKGRIPSGTRCVHAKLTKESVDAVRTLTMTQRQLAQRFGVSQATISLVRNYHCYK